MVYKKAKFFLNTNKDKRTFFCVPFDDNTDYYAFLKEYHSKGYRQIIITSEFMIHLMEYFILERRFSVYDIILMEEDEDLKEEIDNLLINTRENSAYFCTLIEKIRFLSEKSSIEIKRLYFKGRINDQIGVKFYLQANGIIGIDSNGYELISKKILELIERYLF